MVRLLAECHQLCIVSLLSAVGHVSVAVWMSLNVHLFPYLLAVGHGSVALFPYLPAVGCWMNFINCALSPYLPAVGRGSVDGWDHVSIAAWISSIMYFVIFFQTSVVGRSSVGCWCNKFCILYLFISSQSWHALLDTIMLLFSNYSGIFYTDINIFILTLHWSKKIKYPSISNCGLTSNYYVSCFGNW